MYFLVYTVLKNSVLTSIVGDSAAAFLSGAAAGVGAWIPIYPSDVVKTLVTVTTLFASFISFISNYLYVIDQ